jgi:hypothetical protein
VYSKNAIFAQKQELFHIVPVEPDTSQYRQPALAPKMVSLKQQNGTLPLYVG